MTRSTEPIWNSFSGLFGRRNVANNAPHIIPYIRSDSRIIDVGCGIGSITLDLARRAPEGQVVGLDYSADSIAIAREEARKTGIHNVTFAVADAVNLGDYESNSFDIVHAHQLLIHLSEPRKALAEMRRLAKQGGIVASRDNIDFFHYPAAKESMATALSRRRERARARGAAPDAGLMNHVWMRDVGFELNDFEFGSVTWDLHSVEDKMDWAAGAVGLAAAGGHGEDAMRKLKEDWEWWAGLNESRLIGVDGWVVGKK